MSNARNIANLPNGDDAPVYACRAWVNFNGTGTVAIRDSGNVASITDNGTGDYTINFATAMPDTNYCVQVSGARSDTANGMAIIYGSAAAPATGSIRVRGQIPTTSDSIDIAYCMVAIFR